MLDDGLLNEGDGVRDVVIPLAVWSCRPEEASGSDDVLERCPKVDLRVVSSPIARSCRGRRRLLVPARSRVLLLRLALVGRAFAGGHVAAPLCLGSVSWVLVDEDLVEGASAMAGSEARCALLPILGDGARGGGVDPESVSLRALLILLGTHEAMSRLQIVQHVGRDGCGQEVWLTTWLTTRRSARIGVGVGGARV
jgi:hypothetical protein